jgi:hypothetical protein
LQDRDLGSRAFGFGSTDIAKTDGPYFQEQIMLLHLNLRDLLLEDHLGCLVGEVIAQ